MKISDPIVVALIALVSAAIGSAVSPIIDAPLSGRASLTTSWSSLRSISEV
jgi:xanthosine utilization system XapX-like protein